jgi:hypothetical protein
MEGFTLNSFSKHKTLKFFELKTYFPIEYFGAMMQIRSDPDLFGQIQIRIWILVLTNAPLLTFGFKKHYMSCRNPCYLTFSFMNQLCRTF